MKPTGEDAVSQAATEAAVLAEELENTALTVPDELTEYLLGTVGVASQDTGSLRLISLAAQRFLRMVMADAQQIAKRRYKQQQAKKGASAKEKEKAVGPWALTAEDLSTALREYGINHKVPPYFLDRQGQGLV